MQYSLSSGFLLTALVGSCVGTQQSVPESPQPEEASIAAMSCDEVASVAVDSPKQARLLEFADKYMSCGTDSLIFDNLLTARASANLLTHLESKKYPVMEKLGAYLLTHQGTKLFAKSAPTEGLNLATEWLALKKFALTKAPEQRLCKEFSAASIGSSNPTAAMWYLREADCQGEYAIAGPLLQSEVPNERYAACKTWGWLGGGPEHMDRMIELSETDPTQGMFSDGPKDRYSVRWICAGAISKILDRTNAATLDVGKTSLTYTSVEAMQSKLYLPTGATLLANASSATSVTYTAPSSNKRIPWSIRIGKIGAASQQEAERNVTQLMGKVESSKKLPGNRFQVTHQPRGIARSIDVFSHGASAHCEGPASEAEALSAICASFLQLP